MAGIIDTVGGATAILACALAWAMAVFAYSIGPQQIRNRALALLLFFQGLEMGPSFGVGQLLGQDQPGHPLFAPLRALNAVAFLAQPWLYLALLGTLDSSLVRPFRSPRVQAMLAGIALLPFVAWPFVASRFVNEGGFGPWYGAALAWHGFVMMFGLIVALTAWRRAARGSMTRARNRAFAIAFGVRDVGIATQIIVFGLILHPAPGTVIEDLAHIDYSIIIPLSVVAFVLLMGYGMAKAQLFDVDVKVRLGVRRGTVAAVFLVVFLVVAQLIQNYTSTTFGVVGGAVAAGVTLFALRPIERAAERISVAAVPRARPIADLPHDERHALYREQVALAWEDGQLALKERRMLDAARERLGLSAEDAMRIERQALPAVDAIK